MLQRPVIHWSLATALTLSVAAWVHDTRTELDRRAAAEETVVTWVTTRDLSAGSPVDIDSFSRRSVPASVVPDGTITRDELPGGRLRRDLRRGEMLGADALASHASSALAAMLDENERAIAVPLAPTIPELERGDLVDVVTLAGSGSPDAPTSTVAAPHARVVSVDAAAVTLAVDAGEVAAVADGNAVGHVTLTLRSGQPGSRER